MPFTIPVAFVDQYTRNFSLLSQQKGSRLLRSVTLKPGVVGSRFDIEQVGATTATKIISRYSDTPMNNPAHLRRWGTMTDYGWGALIDKRDKIKLLIDPQSAYTMDAVWAMGRAMDDELIAASFGPASSGHDGSATTAFPASQIVPVADHSYDTLTGNVGLSISKLIVAKKKIRAANVDPDEPLFLACKESQIADMLGSTKATSIWYNSVKTLVEGTVDHFMGFTFLQTERVGNDGTNDQVIAYTKSGLALGMGEEPRVEVGPNPGKRFSLQIYAEMSLGAVRTEEAKVVQILCLPA